MKSKAAVRTVIGLTVAGMGIAAWTPRVDAASATANLSISASVTTAGPGRLPPCTTRCARRPGCAACVGNSVRMLDNQRSTARGSSASSGATDIVARTAGAIGPPCPSESKKAALTVADPTLSVRMPRGVVTGAPSARWREPVATTARARQRMPQSRVPVDGPRVAVRHHAASSPNRRRTGRG